MKGRLQIRSLPFMINIFFKSYSFLRIAFFKASFLRTSFRRRCYWKFSAISWRQTTKNDAPDSRDRVPDVAASSPSYPYNHYRGWHRKWRLDESDTGTGIVNRAPWSGRYSISSPVSDRWKPYPLWTHSKAEEARRGDEPLSLIHISEPTRPY